MAQFFYDTVTLILKLHKDSTKKKNYGTISFMNIDTNILNKTLARDLKCHSGGNLKGPTHLEDKERRYEERIVRGSDWKGESEWDVK